MRRKRALRIFASTEQKNTEYRSSLWSVRLPSASSPLTTEDGLRIRGAEEHALFLRCCELYRVIELNCRTLLELIETYSKYRTRDHFRESFAFRYFDCDLLGLASCDASLVSAQNALFNILHELRISLSFTDALPHTIRSEIERVLHLLAQGWNELRDAVFERYGWDFKRIEF